MEFFNYLPTKIRLYINKPTKFIWKLKKKLKIASHNGHLETVEYLISKGADIYNQDHYGGTPINAGEFTKCSTLDWTKFSLFKLHVMAMLKL